MNEALTARRLDYLIWAIVAAVAAAVAIGGPLRGFHFVWSSFNVPGGASLATAAGAWFYRHKRSDPRLAAALEGTAQLIVFSAVAAPLSYLGASLALPLHDRMFDAADKALGLDWLAMLDWMNAHAGLHPAFRQIYWTLIPQMLLIVLALAWWQRLVWLRVFMLAFFIATIATIAIAAVLPAEGVWGHYGLRPADYPDIAPATNTIHLPIFHGLRDGSFRLLMAAGAEGIITFPSLHSALAVLLTVGLWPLPVLRWVGVVLNGLMLFAIPVDGGHYFIDAFAGVVVALASFAIARDVAQSLGMMGAPQRIATSP